MTFRHPSLSYTHPITQIINSTDEKWVRTVLYSSSIPISDVITEPGSPHRGLTMLILAIRDQNIARVMTLMQHPRQLINPNMKCATNGMTPLMYVMAEGAGIKGCTQEERPEANKRLIDILFALGAHPNLRSRIGSTAAHLTSHRPSLFYHLCDRYFEAQGNIPAIDLSIPTDDGTTIFDLAAEKSERDTTFPIQPHATLHPITARYAQHIITQVNRKYRRKYLPAIRTLLRGTHVRFGQNSPLRIFRTSPMYDALLFPLIFSYLYRSLPTTRGELPTHIPRPPPNTDDPHANQEGSRPVININLQPGGDIIAQMQMQAQYHMSQPGFNPATRFAFQRTPVTGTGTGTGPTSTSTRSINPTTPSSHPCARFTCTSVGTLQCSRCKSVRYCGTTCQQTDWSIHKKQCKKA